MSKILIKKARIAPYRCRIWIVVSPSLSKAVDIVEDQIHTKIGLKDIASTRAFAYQTQDDKDRGIWILFIRPTSKPGEIAHECKHLVNFIFAYFGVKLSLTNDEPEAYFLERIVDLTHNAISQYRKLYIRPKKDTILIDKLLNPIHNN